LKNFIYIGLAAAIGAWSRWGLGILLNTLHPIFPIGTLTVNLLGGYLMGVSMGAFEFFSDLSPDLKLIINSSILAPVFWSWIIKPICKHYKLDYKQLSLFE